MNERFAAFKNGEGTQAFKFCSKGIGFKNRIMDHLVSKYRYDLSFEVIIIAKSILTEAIIDVEGVSDKRRINSRIDLLKSKNCIKESDDSDPQHKRYIFVSQLVPLYN
jgi:hypothetical protein